MRHLSQWDRALTVSNLCGETRVCPYEFMSSRLGPARHRTASGEEFNPSGMTVAHKSLPFGTCLVIGNPQTGRKVSVRVNDRGPSRQVSSWTFHRERQRPSACDRHKA